MADIFNCRRFLLLTIMETMVIISIYSCSQEYCLTANLIGVQDDKLWADSVDQLNVRSGAVILSAKSSRVIVLRYRLRNTSEHTLFLPVRNSYNNKYKSFVSASIQNKDTITLNVRNVYCTNKLGLTDIIPPGDSVQLQFQIEHFSTIWEEKNNAIKLNDLISGLHLSYHLDSVDLQPENYPVPRIIFDNNVSNIIYNYIPAGVLAE